MKEIRKDAEQVLKLEDTIGMIRAIASNHLQVKDVYYCTIAGIKTAVIK